MWLLLFSCSSQWQKGKACLATKQREIFFLFPLAIPTVLCSQEPGKTHPGVLHAQDEAGKCILRDHKFNIPLPCKAYDFCVKHGNSTGDEIKASERGKTDSGKKGKKK